MNQETTNKIIQFVNEQNKLNKSVTIIAEDSILNEIKQFLPKTCHCLFETSIKPTNNIWLIPIKSSDNNSVTMEEWKSAMPISL
jgi:hypothetical protein